MKYSLKNLGYLKQQDRKVRKKYDIGEKEKLYKHYF